MRKGLTRRTGSTRGNLGAGSAGLEGVGTSAIAGAGITTEGWLSGLLVARMAARTRLVISAAIESMEASNATVTAARTCSSSITATKGAKIGRAHV